MPGCRAEKYDRIVCTDVNGNKPPEQFDDEYQDDTTSIAEEQSMGNKSDTSDDKSNKGSTSTPQQVENDENRINDGNMDELPQPSANEEEEIITEERYEEGTEDPYESQITIDDINIVTEMNRSQMATQQEEERDSSIPTHGYNLREHPTRQSERVSLAIANRNKTTKPQEWKTNDKT